jgi:Dyp-type peroxidase family protein
VDRADIQGIVLHGYRSAPFARYHLLRFAAGDARRWLTRTIVDISSARDPRERVRQNVAFTALGLEALGLTAAEMRQFPRVFRQGMAHPERSRALGDHGDDSPEHWEFGGATDALSGLLMTYAESVDALGERCARNEALLERFGITWVAQNATLQALTSEDAAGVRVRDGRKREKVAAGEFVLGYRDAVGERIRGPFVTWKASTRPLPEWSQSQGALDLGSNGSYLVLRKLARGEAYPAGELARLAELADAHARRARGPEQSSSHRLLRRSRQFASSEGEAARGLWFIALNADIRRQFEFIQENYLNATLELGDDPRVDISRLMRVRGGGYFFVPGIRSLNYLAESAG